MKALFNLMCVVALCAAFVAFGAQARADQMASRSSQSVVVGYSDLDVSVQSGVRQLYHRLQKAAEKVCLSREDYHNLAMFRDRQHCLDSALDDAVQHVNLSALAQMHFKASGRSVGEREQIAGGLIGGE